MPLVVFSDHTGAKLIQLQSQYVREKSGWMMTRAVADKAIAESHNKYARVVSGPDAETNFTAAFVHKKEDNLKTKAMELYRRFLQKTATGAPAGDINMDNSCDVNGAITTCANLKIWHNPLRPVPGYGPLDIINSLSVSPLSTGTSMAHLSSTRTGTTLSHASPPSTPNFPVPTVCSSMTIGDDSGEEARNAILFGACQVDDLSYTPGQVSRKRGRLWNC